MSDRKLVCCWLWVVYCLVSPSPAAAAPLEKKLLESFRARLIGPANMGGRVVDVAVVPSKPSTLYVATASGGLWKTVNNGTTWTPVFDHQKTISIGDVAVAPSHPDIVWVGTGENNARNSVSWGDGIYKSSDGGKTWQNMGLRDSAHIGRIVIHPHNPNIVYVAALGHLWGPNKERGLFKTRDGGKTWQIALFLNEDTGFIDVAMDPTDPETLYAAAYQIRRDAFSGGNPATQTGPGSGLFKTTDGGKNWTPLTRGLPDRPLGRCGLDIYAKDPRILYAVIQTDKTIATVMGQPAKTGSDVALGGIFRSDDHGETWTKLNDLCPRPFYYGQIRIDPGNDQRLYVLGVHLHVSADGGRSFLDPKKTGAARIHPDHHALWINPRDPDHLVLGCDGGVHFSYDRGAHWEHVNNLPIAQFYAVGVDMRTPYRVYGGLQDNGSWFGPSATRNPDGITLADWHRILGADGFYCQIDPTDPDTVYAEAQYGRLRRLNVRTGAVRDLKPDAPQGQPAFRFNWCSPILLSPHNPRIVYFGGNHLFRSVDRGDHWETISPDLTRGKPGSSEHTGHTLTALAESPLKPGLLYAGSDDGRVHLSRDGGAAWIDLSERLPIAPPERWITRIECSRFDEGTAYLTLDRHRNDDRQPYIFKTSDYGATWQALVHGLPAAGPVHVLREDARTRDLLFTGTEFGLYVSVDGGQHWQRLRAGLPTVAVHDLVIHPREHELVIGTHGRGIYILDIAPLEQLTPQVLGEQAYLFDVKPVLRYQPRGSRSWTGSKPFLADNPPLGAVITYYLRDDVPVRVTVANALGVTVAVLGETKEAGIHHATWDLRLPAKSEEEAGPPAPPGDYVVRLQIGDQTLLKKFRLDDE